MYHYLTLDELKSNLPYGCELIGIELDEKASPLSTFDHPARVCYLLGAEDHGLTPTAKAACHKLIAISGAARCLNVSTAGSIVLYDRVAKAALGDAP